jgi:hypothetical protein
VPAPRPPAGRPVSLAPARPQVALAIDIDTGYYRTYLDDQACTAACDKLRASLYGDVRALVASRYPFLQWVESAPDTVQITWANGADFYSTELDFRIRGSVPRMAKDKFSVPFEPSAALRNRTDEGWAPESLQTAWRKQLELALASGDLVAEVFGRLPVNPQVDFRNARAIVSPAPDEIERAARPPVYVLRVHVRDPAEAIEDDADIQLTRCIGNGTRGYSCPVDKLYFANDSVQGARIDRLLQRGAIAVRAVRLSRFEAKSLAPATVSRGPTQ